MIVGGIVVYVLHLVFVRFPSDRNAERIVLGERFCVFLQLVDKVDVLPGCLDRVYLAKLDELVSLERVERWGIEEDLGC
jgi:hypothetical protein